MVAGLWGRLGRIALQRGPGLLKQVLDPVPPPAGRQPGSGNRPDSRPSDTHGPPGGHRPPRRVRTAERARRISYSPALDGDADPGEVVWTWVPYEEQDGRGKDRPVLVVGRDGADVLALMLTSREHDDPDWLPLGAGAWDGEHRPSWVRLDRVLEVDADGIRREGAVLDRPRFDRVADALRAHHGWS